MTLGPGGYLDVQILESDWLNVKSYVDKAGFPLTGQEIQASDGPLRQFEISWVHWKPIKEVLEERQVPYSYRDMSTSPTGWKSWP